MLMLASRKNHEPFENEIAFASEYDHPRYIFMVGDRINLQFLVKAGFQDELETYKEEGIDMYSQEGLQPGKQERLELLIPFVVTQREYFGAENKIKGYFSAGECFITIEPASDAAEQALLWIFDHDQER